MYSLKCESLSVFYRVKQNYKKEKKKIKRLKKNVWKDFSFSEFSKSEDRWLI